MARVNPRKPKKTPSVPQTTSGTTARIQSTTGRISTGSSIDRLRYHQRPTIREREEVEEAELSTQTVSTAGVIGTIGKVSVKAGEVATKIAPKVTTKKIKQAGRRTVAPGIATAVAGPMEKPKPVEKTSTDIFGATVPGHDDESYKEGPSHLFDWGGYYNVLRGVVVPTEQMIQMPKDILEGVPEEKRTMRESGLDLALMPILAPLVGQQEYGIGDQPYQPWEFGFADPRNIFTGAMSHNLMTAGYVLQQPKYYETVGQEYDVSAKKWDKHKPYYTATVVGELPYFLLGVGEGAMAARLSTKLAAMSVRTATGAQKYVPGTARYFKEPIPTKASTVAEATERATAIKMTQISRPWLAGKGQILAYDIESAPSRIAQAITRFRKPAPVGVTMQAIVRETSFGDLETIYVPRPAQKTSWADIGAPDSKIKRFVHRVTRKRQQDSYDLANLFSQRLKHIGKPPSEMLFLSETGDILHMPGMTSVTGGRYVGGSTRGIYENLLDPSISETIIGQPITRYMEPTAGLTGDTQRGLSQVLGDSDLAKIMQEVLSEQSEVTIENASLFGRTTTGRAIPAIGKVTGPSWATGFMRKNIPSITEKYRPQDLISNLQRLTPKTVKRVDIRTGEKYEQDIPHWRPGGGPSEYFGRVGSGVHAVGDDALVSKVSFGFADAPTEEIGRYLSSKRYASPPAQTLQKILEERGFRVHGTKEPIPGTDQAKQFNKLTEDDIDIQRRIDVLTKTKAYDGMKGVSWFELSTEGRFTFQKRYGFGSQIPNKIRGASGPDVAKLKAEYASVKNNMTEATAIEGEAKLRSIGNKISMKMYGEKGIDTSNIREAKTIYQKARTGTLDKEFAEVVTTSLPFQTQKQITALKMQQELIAVEKKALLDKTPQILGPASEKVKVMMETKTDPLTGMPLKESIFTFQPPKGVRVYREPGKSAQYGEEFYRIEVEGIGDPTTTVTPTYYAHKATKHAAKLHGIPDPKYHVIPKTVKGKTKKDVWIIQADIAKEDDAIISKLMGSSKTSKEQTKILETDLGDTTPLQDPKLRSTYGIEESFEVLGREDVTKLKRLKTIFPWKSTSLFRRTKVTSQRNIEGEEIIEGKKVYRLSNKGIDYSGDGAVEWELTRKDVVKFLNKGTTGVPVKDKVLSARHMLFGGGSPTKLRQTILDDDVKLKDVTRKIGDIGIEREKLGDEADRKAILIGGSPHDSSGVKGIYTGQLRDERNSYQGDYIGALSKSKTPSQGKPGSDVLHMDNVNEKTILRYDVEDTYTPEYGPTVVSSTPKKVAADWVELNKREKSVKDDLKANVEALKTYQSLITKTKAAKITNEKTGESVMTLFGESGVPLSKSVKSLDVLFIKSQMDNEITAQGYKGLNNANFARIRSRLESQMHMKKPSMTGGFIQKRDKVTEAVIPEEDGQAFKASYDQWDTVYTEVIDKPYTIRGKVSELAKKHPAFDEVKLPDEITDVKDNLERTKRGMDDIRDKIDNFSTENLDSPHFELLKAHESILEETEDLLTRKLTQLERNKEFFAEARAKGLIDDMRNADGELPTEVQNKIREVRLNRKDILKTGFKVRSERYRLTQKLYKRVARKGKRDFHTLFHSPDGAQNFLLGKTKQQILSDKPIQHDIRQRRSKLEMEIEHKQLDKHDKMLDIKDYNITELKGYAKLNLELQLMDQLKSPTSSHASILSIKEKIASLDTIAGRSDYERILLDLATDSVPDDYAKTISVDTKTNIVSSSKLKVISGGNDNVDQIAIKLAAEYGFDTGGTMPKGFKTSSGPNKMFAKRYGLKEGETKDYPSRTAKNVEDADLTIVYGDVKVSSGKKVVGKKIEESESSGFTKTKYSEASEPIGDIPPKIEGSPGSRLTVREAIKQGKPYLINPSAKEIESAVKLHHAKVINVAGSRAKDTYSDNASRQLKIFMQQNKPDTEWSPTTTKAFNVVDPDKFITKHPDWYDTLMPEALRPIDSEKILDLHKTMKEQHPNTVNIDGKDTVRFMNVAKIKSRKITIRNEIDNIEYGRITREPETMPGKDGKQVSNPKYEPWMKDEAEFKSALAEKKRVLLEEEKILKKLFKEAEERKNLDDSYKSVNYTYLTDDNVIYYPGNVDGTLSLIRTGKSNASNIKDVDIPRIEGQIQLLEVEKAGIESIVKVDPRYQKWAEQPGNWGAESHFSKWLKYREIPQLLHSAKVHKRGVLYKLHKEKAILESKKVHTQKRIDYVEGLPLRWREFSMIPRGTRITMTAQTLADDSPLSKETVVEIRSDISKGGDGNVYIVKDNKFYKLPDGNLSPEEMVREGVTELSDTDVQRLFPKPYQNIVESLAERRKNLVDKAHPLDMKYGVEPTAIEKFDMIQKGLPSTYTVRQTPIGKLAAGVFKRRGGVESRVGGEFTLSGNINVVGQITERFIEDLGRRAERKAGTVAGAKVVTKPYDDFSRKYTRGQKTVYEMQYPISRYLAGQTEQIPAGVMKERIYQMPTVLPDRPSEDLIGLDRILQRDIVGDVSVRYKMDITDEPSLSDIYPTDMNMKRYTDPGQFGKSPLADTVYETLPMRVANYVSESGASGKQVMRRTISFKYLKNVQGHKLKKDASADSLQPFVQQSVNDEYMRLTKGDDTYFQRVLQDIDAQGKARRASPWEYFQQSLFHQDMEARHGFISIHDVMPGDTWLGKGAIHSERLKIQNMPGADRWIRKEVYVNPIELMEHQTLLRAARDSGTPLNAQDKRFLKMKVKLSEAEIATQRIKATMIRDTGSETGPRDYSNLNFKKLAERDETWKPLYEEQKVMSNYLNRVEVLNMSIRQNEENLAVIKKINVSDRTKTQTNQMTSIKKKLDELKIEKEAKEDYLAGYYSKPAKNREQDIIQKILKDPDTGRYLDSTAAYTGRTQLKDIQPKPIGERVIGKKLDDKGNVLKDKDGKDVLIYEKVYEETPFSGFPKVGEAGFLSKREEYFKWMSSEEAKGPTRPSYSYKKEYTATMDTPAGKRLKPTSEQKVRSEMREGEQPWRVQSTYDPTYVSAVDDTSPYSFQDPVTKQKPSAADVARLKKSIAGKKLSPEGITNSNERITQLQKSLTEMNTKDTTKYSAREMGIWQSERNLLLEQLRLEVNRRGMQSDRISKFKPIDVEDIEKGTYTPEGGSSAQAAMLAERSMSKLLGPGRIQTTRPQYTGMHKKSTILQYSPSLGVIGLTIPEASASQGPASATLQDNLNYLSQTISADTIQTPDTQKHVVGIQKDIIQSVDPRSKTREIPVLNLKPDTIAAQKQPQPTVLSSIESSRHATSGVLREGVVLREEAKFRLQMPEPLKTVPVTQQREIPTRVTTPTRLRTPLPVAFVWLDPAEQAKKAAKLKKKKKRKIAWAAPDWWAGKGYYFPSGAAYTSFKKKEPRVVRRQEKKLGELKWSDSRTKSVFDERSTKRKPRNPTAPPRKTRKRKRGGNSFGLT